MDLKASETILDHPVSIVPIPPTPLSFAERDVHKAIATGKRVLTEYG